MNRTTIILSKDKGIIIINAIVNYVEDHNPRYLTKSGATDIVKMDKIRRDIINHFKKTSHKAIPVTVDKDKCKLITKACHFYWTHHQQIFHPNYCKFSYHWKPQVKNIAKMLRYDISDIVNFMTSLYVADSPNTQQGMFFRNLYYPLPNYNW